MTPWLYMYVEKGEEGVCVSGEEERGRVRRECVCQDGWRVNTTVHDQTCHMCDNCIIV